MFRGLFHASRAGHRQERRPIIYEVHRREAPMAEAGLELEYDIIIWWLHFPYGELIRKGFIHTPRLRFLFRLWVFLSMAHGHHFGISSQHVSDHPRKIGSTT